MLKVKLDIMKPWITKRIGELLGIEDDVVIEFVFNQLEEKVSDDFFSTYGTSERLFRSSIQR